jgi:hypothetical protein
VREVFEGVREGQSSGGVVPCKHHRNRPGGDLNQGKAWKPEDSQEEENKRLETPVKFAKSRGSSDQGGSHAGVNP